MQSELKNLVGKTSYILREVKARFKNPLMLWSTGKDSTALLYIIKQTFFGKIPFTVLHINTGYKFPEIYKFRTKLYEDWQLPLHIVTRSTRITPEQSIFYCCYNRKTLALKTYMETEKIDAVILAIRWDELGVRSKEHYFSPRTTKWEWRIYRTKTEEEMKEGDSPIVVLTEPELWNLYQTDFGKNCSHVRIHPMLHWSEIEVWKYIKENNIPFNPLYLSKEGKRYRSLGCIPCTKPINSNANTIDKIIEELEITRTGEREGRIQKDKLMERLRFLGYM